jgi:hypothetical protein
MRLRGTTTLFVGGWAYLRTAPPRRASSIARGEAIAAEEKAAADMAVVWWGEGGRGVRAYLDVPRVGAEVANSTSR